MKYLKQFLQGGIFLVVCAMVFIFSSSSLFALSPNDKCGPDNKGTCKLDHCDGDDNIGECEGYPYGSLFCCVPSGTSVTPSEDYQCEQAGGGTCKPTVGSNQGCNDNEIPNGLCKSNGVSTTQTCCKVKDSPVSGSGAAAALNYTPLENLPGFEGQGGDFATYFKNLYLLAIWIVGISALFMLVVGGFLYLSSAGNTSLLGSAKKTIYGALIGIIIALISWLLLDTINSDLTNLKLSGLSSAVGGDGTNKTGDGKPSTATGKTDKSGCEALNNNVVKNQCNLASEEIVKVLSCIESKGIKLGKNVGGYQQYSFYSLASNGVGGDQNASAACCGNSGGGKCPHSNTSCHHGCDYGTKGLSYAVDIWTEGLSDDEICNLASIAKSCGSGAIWGPFTKCGIVSQPGHSNHLHVSTSGCNH